MQTIPAQLAAIFRSAVKDAFAIDADPVIVPSGNEKFGDYQCNAAMGLAKTLAAAGQKTNPRRWRRRSRASCNWAASARSASLARGSSM